MHGEDGGRREREIIRERGKWKERKRHWRREVRHKGAVTEGEAGRIGVRE